MLREDQGGGLRVASLSFCSMLGAPCGASSPKWRLVWRYISATQSTTACSPTAAYRAGLIVRERTCSGSPPAVASRREGAARSRVRKHTWSGCGFTGTGWRTERARTVPGTACRTQSAEHRVRPVGRTGRTGRRSVFPIRTAKKEKEKTGIFRWFRITPYAGARRVEVVEIIGRIRVSQACR